MKLRYTLPALANLNAIFDYIGQQSPQGAAHVKRRIQAVINLLLLHPRIGTRTSDPAIRRMTTLPYPYLVFYEAANNEIIIHAVRHASRKPSSMPCSGDRRTRDLRLRGHPSALRCGGRRHRDA